MTDRTPHESLPMKSGTKRQYFRLVLLCVYSLYLCSVVYCVDKIRSCSYVCISSHMPNKYTIAHNDTCTLIFEHIGCWPRDGVVFRTFNGQSRQPLQSRGQLHCRQQVYKVSCQPASGGAGNACPVRVSSRCRGPFFRRNVCTCRGGERTGC